jgi:DNA-binding CsgD family transcriptional regulator/pimeloyl-ACP methyl ester carboxylesterase
VEPRVRYAQTDDGVSIAFGSVGSGPPLVLLPTIPFAYFQLEWEIPEYRTVFEALAQYVQLVQYDARGSGLSQREVRDVSFEAMLRDLEAVVRRANLERFALLGLFGGAPIALGYAAHHPEQVSHLVLWAAFADGQVAQGDPQTQALLSLIERDWSLFTETAASAWMGWLPSEAARRVARAFRAGVTPEMARAMLDAARRTDVTALLQQVSAPTLVLHRAGMPLDMQGPREVLANVRGAQLDLLPGDSASPYIGDWTSVVRDVLRFCLDDPSLALADDPLRSIQSGQTPPEGLTHRELEVLRGVAAGDANQQIATSLGVSVHTVERHVANIYRKIDARGRADATAYALRHGLA